jgi:hypothetical protein
MTSALLKYDVSEAYQGYIGVVFQIDIDLQFWNNFLKYSISTYQEKEASRREIFSSLFGAYDIDVNNDTGYLKLHKESRTINIPELQEYREQFFGWVINSSIVKIYVAIETVLTQTIWVTYYPSNPNPQEKNKNAERLMKEIRTSLRTAGHNDETKNNHHIIEFLTLKSTEYEKFLKKPIRVDLKTTWRDFFELVSILRNIVSHVGSKIEPDTLNEIKSKAKDIFERHFDNKEDEYGELHLVAVQAQIGNFINLMNDFTLNTLKIVRNERDFRFLNMK